jgi:hypothetical protein
MSDRSSNPRTQRSGWAKPIQIVISDRDIEVLRLLYVEGFAPTAEIVSLHFPSRTTGIDRLRKLYCAGYTQCFVRDLKADNVYALTAKGRDALVDAGLMEAESFVVPSKLPKNLDHRFAILSMRVLFAKASGRSCRYALAEFQSDRVLSAERHRSLLALIPDAKFTIRNTQTDRLSQGFLECDRSTESTVWLVGQKLRKYAEAQSLGTSLYGLASYVVVVVAPTLRRACSIARRMVQRRVRGSIVLAVRSLLTESNVFADGYAWPAELAAAHSEQDILACFRLRLLP